MSEWQPLLRALPDVPGWSVFWLRWPHKVAKKAAMKEYGKAVRRASPEKIVAGEEWYIANKPAGQAWAHAATWLRGDRWEDGQAWKVEVDEDAVWEGRAWKIRHQIFVPDDQKQECLRRGLITGDEA